MVAVRHITISEALGQVKDEIEQEVIKHPQGGRVTYSEVFETALNLAGKDAVIYNLRVMCGARGKKKE